jgi:hypothetical protein
MKVLVACEESQAVTKEFRRLGHEAYSCDIIECSGGHPEWHIQADVLPLLNGRCEFETADGQTHIVDGKWDMIIGFPPCTYLSNAGACRLYPKKGQLDLERYKKGMEAKEFFLKIYNADCPRIALENPVSSKVFEMPPHTQEIQPYHFGHPCTKKTRLWLKGLPLLIHTDVVEPLAPYVPSGTGRKRADKYGTAKRGNDSLERSKTFAGIAKAMAEQWAGENKEKQEREENEMELKMNSYNLPEAVSFNYEELKTELQAKVSMYETLQYTDTQIQEAKKDKANLNKLKKALNDERIRLQKEYMQPFNDFKAKIDELISIIDTPVALIDKQVKEYDEIKKQEKKAEIQDHFDKIAFPAWVQFEMIFNERWLNSSVSMKSVQTEIEEICTKIEADLATLENLPEFAFESKEAYKTTLDLQKSIQEGARLAEIQKRKKAQEEEAARRKSEEEFAKYMNPPVEPKVEAPRTWIGFKANLTTEDALALREFFEARKIEYEAIAI